MRLPASFIAQTRSLLGDDECQKLTDALLQDPPVSIRVNRNRVLPASDLLLEPVPWSTDGRYLNNRLTFTFDPLFHAGCYYVQEASSMFVEQALRQYVAKPVVMLDLCAAPGGKSTHARSVLPEGSLLVANELIRNRSQILAENLTKWGHPGVVVTNNEPADFAALDNFFDVILTDVPCSGEGMFRKDPVAISEWSQENVEVCWQRQRRILTDIWTCLRPGGLLIYSTCTYNIKEDEGNIVWMMQEFGAQPLPIEVSEEWGITGSLLSGADAEGASCLSGSHVEGSSSLSGSHNQNASALPVYRFLPHRTKGEGFFLAALRKPSDADTGSSYGDARSPESRTGFSSVDAYSSENRAGYSSADSRLPDSFSRNDKRSKKGNDYNTSKKSSGKGGGKAPSLLGKELLVEASRWLLQPDTFELMPEGNTLTAFPKVYTEELAQLRQSLRVIQAGIDMGELKGKDFMPGHALAMSQAYRPGSFPTQEVTYEQAIAYLRKESITLPDEAIRGYVLLTYRGVALGFVKNIGNRANNLYPQEWRIRSGYMPEKLLIY